MTGDSFGCHNWERGYGSVGGGDAAHTYSALRDPSAYDALEELTQSKRAGKSKEVTRICWLPELRKGGSHQSGKPFNLAPERLPFAPRHTFSQNSEHRSEVPQLTFFSIRLSESWVFRDLTG